MMKMNLNSKFKFNKLKKIQRWAYLTTVLVAFVIIFQLGLFLYANVFLAIKQINRITVIQSKVAEQTVNMRNFKQVMAALKNKKNGCLLDKTKDPFYPENKITIFGQSQQKEAGQSAATTTVSQTASTTNKANKNNAKTKAKTAPQQKQKTPPQDLDLSNIRPKH